MQNRLSNYSNHILYRDILLKQNYQKSLEMPRLKKLVVHSSISKTVQNKKHILSSLVALELICGQKLTKTRAKKSVAQFKLRKGNLLGCKATLRANQMHRFLESFLFFILPRFRNLMQFNSFDTRGNLSFGFTNYLLALELENHYELFEDLLGFQCSLLTCRDRRRIPSLNLMVNRVSVLLEWAGLLSLINCISALGLSI